MIITVLRSKSHKGFRDILQCLDLDGVKYTLLYFIFDPQ